MDVEVAIIGGGVTGLELARRLQLDACLFERETRLGGCLRSDEIGGYTIDRTGHLLHFQDPYVRKLMFETLDIDWLHFERRAEIHLLEGRVPYPIQYNLHALPEAERSKCLAGFLKTERAQPTLQDSFEEWSRLSYGDGLHDLFFSPYNRKLWQTDLAGINAEWAERFVPPPDPDLVVQGAAAPHQTGGFGYNSTFSYPARGGSQSIIEALAKQVRIPVRTGVALTSVNPQKRVCVFSDGTTVNYRALVSTIPLPALIDQIEDVDPEIARLADSLRHNSVLYFAFGFKTAGRRELPHWIYIPETEFLMYRVGVLSSYSPTISPAGTTLFCAEIAFAGDEAAHADPAALKDRVLADLAAVGVIEPGWDLEFSHHGVIDCAYVIFDEDRRQALPRILDYLEGMGIHSIGRYGRWGYGSMGDALIEGRDCADNLNKKFLPAAVS